MSGVIAGLSVNAVSMGMSFGQALKAKKNEDVAVAAADKSMAEARKRLSINYAEEQSIKKEAYDLERKAMLAAGAQATQAGIESERGAASTAGRVMAAQQVGQAGVRTAMADEMTNIENSIIEEDMRLRDLNANLDLEEVAGYQQMAADSQEARQVAISRGMQSMVGIVGDGASLPELYNQRAGRKAAKGIQSKIAGNPISEMATNFGSTATVSRLGDGIIPLPPREPNKGINTRVPQNSFGFYPTAPFAGDYTPPSGYNQKAPWASAPVTGYSFNPFAPFNPFTK